jgi:hypothetical protein
MFMEFHQVDKMVSLYLRAQQLNINLNKMTSEFTSYS